MENQLDVEKRHAAVCGLYCGACALFIATAEDPERLKQLAAKLQLAVEEAKCHGCRSDKKSNFCESCKFCACAAERGIEFCSHCFEYPCAELTAFQAERPHRMDLWNDLARVKAIGYEKWLGEIRNRYTCPRCQTINSAYDLKCRKCGNSPSCDYVAEHGPAVERFLLNR